MPLVFKTNPLRETLKRGDVALGIGSLLSNPDVVESAGYSGLDFVWLDLEHSGVSPYDSVSISNFARAADISGTSLMVRVPTSEEHMIGKVLDSGAHAILVPGVRSAQEVEKVVHAAKYSTGKTRGNRGGSSNRATKWRAPDAVFANESDKNILVGVMIETREAVEQLDRILSIEQLDFVFVGRVDLSLAIGHPFQTSETLQKYIDEIRFKCKEFSIPLGTARESSDLASMKNAINDGYRLIRMGTDIEIINSTIDRLLNSLRTAPK